MDDCNDCEIYQIIVTEEIAGQRLDSYLASPQTELSQTRSQIKKLIESECVLLNGKATKGSQKLKEKDLLQIEIPPPVLLNLLPENIPLEILYEDKHLLVINKPAGMVVHPGPGHSSGTLVHALMAHCTDLSGIGGVLRPGIVHRLDKDTSGSIVVAKDDATHQGLAQQFQNKEEGKILRVYKTLVRGRMKESHGIIETFFGRHINHRQKFSSLVPDGKIAKTEYWVEKEWGSVSLLKVKLYTGRTHQIRVHFSDMQRPIVGDSIYGPALPLSTWSNALKQFPRQALHASQLTFVHPITQEVIATEAPLPADFQTLLDILEQQGI